MNGYNFTERVRKVLAMSREEANRLGHEYVGTEHLLLGLIREGQGVAAAALQSLTVDLEQIRNTVEATVKGGTPQRGSPDLPYTSRAKKVLEFAMSEARELNHSYVGTEHILLGLIREEKGIAAQILFDAGLTLAGTREEILRLLGTDEPVSDRLGTGHRQRPRTDAARDDLAAFPPELGKVYDTIRNELAWLYVKWDQFQALYGAGRDRLELLNGTAPLLFRIVQESMWNEIGGHLRALSAKPAQGKAPRMSVCDIPDLIENEQLRKDIHMLVARVTRTTEFVHDAPTRRVVGVDLALALERRARPLDAPSRMMVRDALESITAVLHQLDRHFRQTTAEFETVGYPHGALALLYALQQSRDTRAMRRDLVDRQERPDADGPPPH